MTKKGEEIFVDMMHNLLTLITQSCQKLGRKLQKQLRRINPRKDRPHPIARWGVVWCSQFWLKWRTHPLNGMHLHLVNFFDVIRVLMNCVGRERFAKQEKRDEGASPQSVKARSKDLFLNLMLGSRKAVSHFVTDSLPWNSEFWSRKMVTSIDIISSRRGSKSWSNSYDDKNW